MYPTYTKFVEYNIGTGNHIMLLGSCKFCENKYSPNRTLLKSENKIFPPYFLQSGWEVRTTLTKSIAII